MKGTLRLTNLHRHDGTTIDLSGSSCDVLSDDEASWPGHGKLQLDGFSYRRLSEPGTARSRHAWLLRQMSPNRFERFGCFRPQPYQQAVRALRDGGHAEAARELAILTAVDRRRWSGQGAGARLWQRVQWHLTRNGYRPLYAARWLALWWLIGFLLFGAGYQAHVVLPLDKTAADAFIANAQVPASYEPFCALSYAIDSALPIVSLGQRDKWHVGWPERAAPSKVPARDWFFDTVCQARFLTGWTTPAPAPNATWVASGLTAIRWIYVMAGWFLTTMLVAGVAGLVPRE